MQIYRHLYRALFQILCFMDIPGGKNPESKEDTCAFESLLQGAEIVNKIVVVAKVRHSQRMNDLLVDNWVVAESETQMYVKKKERI